MAVVVVVLLSLVLTCSSVAGGPQLAVLFGGSFRGTKAIGTAKNWKGVSMLTIQLLLSTTNKIAW